jgi:hypothetical protein
LLPVEGVEDPYEPVFVGRLPLKQETLGRSDEKSLPAEAWGDVTCINTWNVNGKLHNGSNRYPAYLIDVEQVKDPAFVYPQGDSRIEIVEKALKVQKISYKVREVGGYVVLIPSGLVTLF